jgi:hypothetical protein
MPGQTGPEEASAGQKPASKPAWTTTVLINLDSAVEQPSHEDAKVGNKGIHGISPKLEAFTWQVNSNHPANLPLLGFFFASSVLFCSLAHADGVVEAGQLLAAHGGLDPQAELADLDLDKLACLKMGL